jgi:hypothetical protein
MGNNRLLLKFYIHTKTRKQGLGFHEASEQMILKPLLTLLPQLSEENRYLP